MIRDAIIALVEEGRSLTEDEATAAMREIMEGEASEAQFGAFVTALRAKGETADEITGMARVMREKALQVRVERRPLLDTCGTGGADVHHAARRDMARKFSSRRRPSRVMIDSGWNCTPSSTARPAPR